MWNVIRIIAGIMMILGGLGNLVSIGGVRAADRNYYYLISIVFFILGAALVFVGIKSLRSGNQSVKAE
jgi:hypothetical membrane protein